MTKLSSITKADASFIFRLVCAILLVCTSSEAVLSCEIKTITKIAGIEQKISFVSIATRNDVDAH